MRGLNIAVALLALFPMTTSAQSIVGAWDRVDITFEGGPNPRTVGQKGIAIFTEDRFAMLEDNTTGRRPLWNDSTTDAERLANFQFFNAGSGTYEMRDGTVTLHLTVAGVPNQVLGGPPTFRISFEGDSMTSVTTNSDGETVTRRYIQVN